MIDPLLFCGCDEAGMINPSPADLVRTARTGGFSNQLKREAEGLNRRQPRSPQAPLALPGLPT